MSWPYDVVHELHFTPSRPLTREEWAKKNWPLVPRPHAPEVMARGRAFATEFIALTERYPELRLPLGDDGLRVSTEDWRAIVTVDYDGELYDCTPQEPMPDGEEAQRLIDQGYATYLISHEQEEVRRRQRVTEMNEERRQQARINAEAMKNWRPAYSSGTVSLPSGWRPIP